MKLHRKIASLNSLNIMAFKGIKYEEDEFRRFKQSVLN